MESAFSRLANGAFRAGERFSKHFLGQSAAGLVVDEDELPPARCRLNKLARRVKSAAFSEAGQEEAQHPGVHAAHHSGNMHQPVVLPAAYEAMPPAVVEAACLARSGIAKSQSFAELAAASAQAAQGIDSELETSTSSNGLLDKHDKQQQAECEDDVQQLQQLSVRQPQLPPVQGARQLRPHVIMPPLDALDAQLKKRHVMMMPHEAVQYLCSQTAEQLE